MASKTKIYTLLDERGVIRYVGKTSASLLHRMNAHLFETRNGKRSHKCNWIRSMLAAGMLPKIEILNEVDGDGNEEEARWISYFKSVGLELVNGTNGGDGAAGRILSEESRRKISVANIGKKQSAETKEKRRISLTGKHRSAEICEKFSDIHKGRKPSEECRKAQLLYVTGHKPSVETRLKMSEAAKGRGTPWLIGKHPSETTRAKMRVAHLARWKEAKQQRVA